MLVVLDLDRLGRLAGELITLIDQLEGRGIAFRALNAPLDTTTPTDPQPRADQELRSLGSGLR